MDKLEQLLDSYYGMQDEESAARAANDVDSANFNVNTYASEVLSSKSLPELMAFQNQMVAETRSLDRDMQDLVYNNYNKFISATDTIRRMRDSVGEMESSMGRLVGEMRAMGGSSALVNENLQANRSKIESLVGVKRLLVKLEFLFELPNRLRRAQELDALAQAVRYYTTVSGVLHKYDNLPSIHAIRIEADGIMDKLKATLRLTLRGAPGSAPGSSSGASASKVVEAIRLLVQLDEPRAPLRSAFLAFQRTRLLSALAVHAARHAPPVAGGSAATAAAAAAAAATAAAAGGASSDGTALLSDRAKAYYAVAAAAKASSVAAPTSVAAARPRAPIPHALFVQGANRVFLDGFRYAADLYVELFEGVVAEGATGAAVSADLVKAAHDELLSFTKDVLGVYFATLRRQLSLPPPLSTPAGGAGPEEANDAGAKRKRGPKARGGGAAAASSGSAPLSPGSSAAIDMEADEDEAEAAREKSATAAAAALAGVTGGAVGRYEAVSDALKMVLTDVRGAARHVKEARLPDRAHEAVEAILRAQLDGLFGDVRGDVARLLVDLRAKANAVYELHRKGAAAAASNPFGASASGGGDWIVASGRALAALAEEASGTISARIDEALAEAKPLMIAAMRLLPDLAKSFSGGVHAQIFALLGWLAAAWEAAGDAWHPSRAEWSEIVIEADLGLERDSEVAAATGAAASAAARRRGAPGSGHSGSGFLSGVVPSAKAKKRTLVNYAAPEADQNAPVPPAAGLGGGILAPEAGDQHHALLLLLAALCRSFAQAGVARALSTMIQSLPSRSELAAMGISGGGGPEDDGEGFGAMGGVPDLIRKVQGAGRELLRSFCFFHGARLAGIIRRSMSSADWLAAGEPRGTRLVVGIVLNDVAVLKKHVAAVLGEWDEGSAIALARHCGMGDGGSAVGNSNAASSSVAVASNPFAPTPAPATLKGPAAGVSASALTLAATAKRTGAAVCAAGLGPLGAGNGTAAGVAGIMGSASRGGDGGGSGPAFTRSLPVDMDRLFAQGPGGGGGGSGGGAGGAAISPGGVGWAAGPRLVLGSVDYSAESVARVLLRLVLKAQLEWTRVATLSAGGLQQLQVDLATVHLALPYFAAKAVGGDMYGNAALLEDLLHSCALAAGERCVDVRPVEPAVLFDIASAALSKLDLASALP